MKIKIHSAEMKRMMKIVQPCLDAKSVTRGIVQITHDERRLTVAATNGSFTAKVYAPLIGGDGESFAVDGATLTRVINTCNGEIEISTDGRCCTVKGAGRTKIPIVSMTIPEPATVEGDDVGISAEDFKSCYGRCAYAVSAEEARVVLTGFHMVTDGNTAKIETLDGFQAAVERVKAPGNLIDVVIPGAFMGWLNNALDSGETLKLITDGRRVQAETDGMTLWCTLLQGEYIDLGKLIPESFGTETLVKVDQLREALKNGNAVNNKLKTVKIRIDSDEMTIMNNSAEADYEAKIPCKTQGKPLNIAFNEAYIIATMNAIGAEDAVMKFNSPVSPMIVQAKGSDGIHLCLPVRIFMKPEESA